MIRKLVTVSLVALTVSATAFAGTSSRDVQVSASKQCAAMQAKLGALSFNRAFASFGACVSALTPLARQSVNTANASCRSERTDANFAANHGGKTFAQFYGGQNAFGKCVSGRERSVTVAAASAASACRTQVGSAAFAACVALKVKPSLTLSATQPTQTPQQQEQQGSTPTGGCGPDTGAGPAHPLVASCTVGKSS